MWSVRTDPKPSTLTLFLTLALTLALTLTLTLNLNPNRVGVEPHPAHVERAHRPRGRLPRPLCHHELR